MSEIFLDRASFTFTQDENCCSSGMGGVEEITIECVSDLGVTRSDGAFYIIKTEQWAIENVDELKDLFNKIEEAINKVK
jgi:hypothetical protein